MAVKDSNRGHRKIFHIGAGGGSKQVGGAGGTHKKIRFSNILDCISSYCCFLVNCVHKVKFGALFRLHVDGSYVILTNARCCIEAHC